MPSEGIAALLEAIQRWQPSASRGFRTALSGRRRNAETLWSGIRVAVEAFWHLRRLVASPQTVFARVPIDDVLDVLPKLDAQPLHGAISRRHAKTPNMAVRADLKAFWYLRGLVASP